MMNACKNVTIVGLLCFSMVSGVIAQQGGSSEQPIRFSIGAAAVATDNRDASTTNKTSNVDFILRPRVDIYAGTGTSFLEIFYEPSLRYRSEPGDNSDETDLQHLLGIKLKHSVSERLRIRLSDQLAVTDDPAILDKGRIMRGDQSYISNQADAGLNFDVFSLSNLDVLLSSRIRRYDEDATAQLSDVDEISGRLQHRHSLTPTLRSLLTGEYHTYNYSDNRLYNVGYEDVIYRSNQLIDRDFNSFIAAVGLEYVFSVNTIGSISAGWQTRDYADSKLDSEGKPYVNAEISGQLNPDLLIGATVGIGLRDSDAYPYASQEYKEFRGFADVQLMPKIVLRLAGTYRLSTYDKQPGPLPGGDETTIIADAEVIFKITDTASLSAGYRMEDVDADEGVGASYTKNIARVGGALSF